MQSPLRPDHSPDKPASPASEAPEARAATRRDPRAAAAPAAALKLLDRRPPHPEPPPRRAPEPKRDDVGRTPAPRSGGLPEGRRPGEAASLGANLGIASARRLQLVLCAMAAMGVGATTMTEIPAGAVVALLGLCLVASAALSLLSTRNVIEVAHAARAVNRGDYGTRAPAGVAEVADLARALNALLDERAALSLQSSEQQQRLQADIHQLSGVLAALNAGQLTQRAQVQTGSLARLAAEINAAIDEIQRLAGVSRQTSGAIIADLGQTQRLAQQASEAGGRAVAGIEQAAKLARAVAERNDSVAQNAQLASVAVRRTTEGAQEGGRAAQGLREAMLDLRRDAQGVLARVQRLASHGSEAAGTVGSLARVAAQANLLALNAAIEASHAGAHGLGFGLVADEVRKLAEDCEEAARALQRVVAEVLAAAGEAGADLERQGARVERLAQSAAQAGELLERIAGAGQQSANLVGEIARTAQDEAGEAEKLEEAILGAVQLGRDLQAGAERSRHHLDAVEAAAQELARRAAAFDAGGDEDAGR